MRMMIDDPADGDAADDRVPEHDRIRSAQSAELAEARDREECYRDLHAYDQASRCPPTGRRPDESRFAGDGGWKWKGLELGPEANRVADEGLAVRQAAEGRDPAGNYGEGGLTPGMRRVEAELEHGTLVPDTEKFALKSPDRFKEKLAKMIERFPGKPCGELVSAIHDGIRYTFLFRAEDYTNGVADATKRSVTADTTSGQESPRGTTETTGELTAGGVRRTAGSCSRSSFTHRKAGKPSREHTISMRSCVIPELRQENVNSWKNNKG